MTVADDDEKRSRGWLYGGIGAAALGLAPLGFVGAVAFMGIGAGGAAQAVNSFSNTPLDASTVPAEYAAIVQQAGSRCPEVSAPLIAAQIEQESRWNPTAESPGVGAQGIAQFMPQTWAYWGKDYNHNGTASPWEPADAINSQADFMCALAGQMKAAQANGTVKGDLLDLMLAGYNAGPQNVIKYGGVPPFAETQKYIPAIKSGIAKYSMPTATVGDAGTGNPAVVTNAKKWLGLPYVWGGGGIDGPSGIGRDGRGPGFDCSGLVMYAIYHTYGIELPHLADLQIRDKRADLIGTKAPGAAPNFTGMQPGDVIGFAPGGGTYSHIGIYAGGGAMVEAPATGKNVRVYDLTNENYWRRAEWRMVRFHK